MKNNIRVYGKAQNRTALGVMHAYTTMFPHATLADIRKAFPNGINPDKGVPELFMPVGEAMKFNDKISLYFVMPDEVLTMGDGSKVAVAQVWSRPSFERIVEQGKLYGVEVAEFEKTAKPGQRGGYRLEYLNGYVPPVPANGRKGLAWWVWLIIAFAVAAVIAALLWPREKEIVVQETVVERQTVVRDTVYMQQIEDIERNFNAAQFAVASADLNDDAKIALHDLARVMRRNPDLKLRITGHTSAEGDPASNQTLSENRARAAVDFLIHRENIDESRLEASGKGSSEPIDPDNAEANRRTEFEIIEQ